MPLPGLRPGPVVYIIGTHHRYQFAASVEDSRTRLLAILDRWRDYLARQVLALDADGVFEEFYPPSLPFKSVAETVAADLDRLYVSCDPLPSERDSAGIARPLDCEIPDARLLDFKERRWIRRLRDRPCSRVLLVCGSGHVARFPVKLQAIAFPSRVLMPDWVLADEVEHGPLPLADQRI